MINCITNSIIIGITMIERATFSLEIENLTFLNEVGGGNKSAYINELLKQEKQKILEKALLIANQEEANDSDYQDELLAWDTTLSDGINP